MVVTISTAQCIDPCADNAQNNHHVLDEGDVRPEEDDPPALELPRTLRVAFAATASTNNTKQVDSAITICKTLPPAVFQQGMGNISFTKLLLPQNINIFL